MSKEAEKNIDNTEESGELLESYSLDDSIEIIADEKGREVRKSADHPNKTRDMICLDDSDNDEDEENEQNLNNN